MNTETDVTFELEEIKTGPNSQEDVVKEAEAKVREVQRKFHKAEQKDDYADRPFKRGWCKEHEDWCPIFSKCLP